MKKKNLSGTCTSFFPLYLIIRKKFLNLLKTKREWDKSPSLSIVFGLSSKTQWLSGLYYADFISFYSPTQLCGGGTTKSNSNELPNSVPLSNTVSVHHNFLALSIKDAFVMWAEGLHKTVYSSTLTGTRPQICSGSWGCPN